jgi:purine-cytosine permease-like protein
MLGTGMSLRQAIVATVIGIALSFIPLGFTTLAGKRSAQPTLVVSRSAFGTGGNVLATILAILVRVFWGGVLLWILGDAIGRALVRGHADVGLGATRWALISAAIGLLLTALVAAIGYGLLARVQLVLSILTGVLIVAVAAITLPQVHLDVALTRQDGPWLLVIGGAVLVFAFVGLVWAFSGSDLARYQRPGGSGASSMLWATFGATIPPFLLIVWGSLLAASHPAIATGFAAHPLSTIAGMLPAAYTVPVLVAACLGLLSGSVLTLYSGGFALQSLTPQVPRVVGVVIAALLALATSAGLVLLGADTRSIVSDLAIVLAVPVAAWAGIFAAEMMIRNRGFHTPSLLTSGGIYPRARWVNLIGLIVIAAIGYGFVDGTASWLGWEGFGWRLLGVDASQPIARVDLGVLLVLVLGTLLPLVSAVPTIRRQERAADDHPAIART